MLTCDAGAGGMKGVELEGKRCDGPTRTLAVTSFDASMHPYCVMPGVGDGRWGVGRGGVVDPHECCRRRRAGSDRVCVISAPCRRRQLACLRPTPPPPLSLPPPCLTALYCLAVAADR